MSSATFAGSPDGSGSPGFCSGLAPPPPPPPPPVPGQMPAMKINTETPMSRRPLASSNDPYEPPAAIQNAMMTKDKKPFTYTPGMGGKLDLSQIRSPRMARRVAKNANDEGIDGPPPKSPLAAEQPRPVSTGANLFIQPQVAVAVFPTGNIPSTPTRGPQINRVLSNASDRNSEGSSQPNTPESPTSPQVILSKAPTPWLQNKTKSQEELPEWAKRSTTTTTNGSSTNVSPPTTPAAANFIQPQLQNKTVNPPRQQSQQRIQMRQAPVQPQEHLVPLQVEDRPSVFTVINEPGHHHQFSNSTPNYQQRWGNPGPPSPPVQPGRVKQSPQSPSGTYFVPMVVEGNSQNSPVVIGNSGYQQQQQQGWDYPQPVSAQSQIKGNGQQRGPVFNQPEPGPVQSRSFRVLQKITDTDNDNVDPEQLRKLQLTEDDKVLMNKFKEQVDGDTYLHQEEDPRYRGAAIPSRAFRYLQNMTDAGENPTNVPRGVNSSTMKRQNRNSQTFAEESQMNLPASEQQVQEPKKYTGSAIPSRSFKILQAMTTPESVAKEEESRQADTTKNRSENSIMMPTQGKQQSVFIPRYPQPIYWAYYPIPYSQNQINYCHDNYHHHYHHHHHEPHAHISDDTNHHNGSMPYSYYPQQDDTLNIYPQTPIYAPQFYAENIPVYPPVQESENPPMIQETEKEIGQDELKDNDPEKKAPDLSKNSQDIFGDDPEEKNYLDETTNVIDDKKKNLIQNESDEGDSETTSSEISELPSAENCQVNDDIIQENLSSSDSSDSDSYLAYSTGRTGGLDEKNIDKQVSSDCESLAEEEEEEKQKEKDLAEKNEEEKLNVITLSGPIRLRSDTPNKIDESGWKTDEEEDAPTIVSVSLPLRPQFPLLKKPEIIDKKPSADSKEIINSVSLSLKIDKEPSTSVDFTLRKNPSSRPKSWCPDKLNDDFWTSKTILGQEETIKSPEENSENNNNNNEGKLINEKNKVPSFEVTLEDDDKIDKVEEVEEESADESKKNKYLLTVQNSRDETDDDDSGVTSDMSRLISEVDTDSECTPSSRKAITYKRTQTHSRLFRLLSEDLSQDTIEKEKSKRRNRLSLPIKNSSEFSYDYSNQSSGMTSPDYSPVYERPSCRNFQKFLNTTTPSVVAEPSEEDRYFKIWKNSKDTDEANKLKNHNDIYSSALVGKFDDNKSSIWSHRSTNVLCPRIKSTRSSDGRIRKPVVHSSVTNYTKYDRTRKSEY